MLLRSVALIAAFSLTSACVADPIEEASPEQPAADDESAAAGVPDWDRQSGYRDICVSGEVKIIMGQAIHVPVFCTRYEMDKGDPEPMGEHLDPLPDVAAPSPTLKPAD